MWEQGSSYWRYEKTLITLDPWGLVYRVGGPEKQAFMDGSLALPQPRLWHHGLPDLTAARGRFPNSNNHESHATYGKCGIIITPSADNRHEPDSYNWVSHWNGLRTVLHLLVLDGPRETVVYDYVKGHHFCVLFIRTFPLDQISIGISIRSTSVSGTIRCPLIRSLTLRLRFSKCYSYMVAQYSGRTHYFIPQTFYKLGVIKVVIQKNSKSHIWGRQK